MSDFGAISRNGENLYRLGRQPDAWDWPDWRCAGPDATFGNRWDDPMGEYRTLYACEQRLGTFLETLANYRPDPDLVAGLDEIEGDEPTPPSGVVPLDWVRTRAMGTARVFGSFAVVGGARSLTYLRRALAGRIEAYHLLELDLVAIRESAPRELAQEVSRLIFEQSVGAARQFQGISYPSRLGDDLQILVLFEPGDWDDLLEDAESAPFSSADPDLHRALETLGLRLEPSGAG
jgi:hypothetical protein